MKIVIEIKGGAVQAIRSTTEDLQIVILDYDNEEVNDDCYQPDNVWTMQGINDYIEKEIKAHNRNAFNK